MRWRVIGVMALAMFIIVLDTTVTVVRSVIAFHARVMIAGGESAFRRGLIIPGIRSVIGVPGTALRATGIITGLPVPRTLLLPEGATLPRGMPERGASHSPSRNLSISAVSMTPIPASTMSRTFDRWISGVRAATASSTRNVA